MTAQGDEVVATEYLYELWDANWDDGPLGNYQVLRYEITKKTPKRIYFVMNGRSGFVDRQRIEADGEILHGYTLRRLHLNPPEIPGQRKSPSLPELKQTMADAHPDRGGTHEAHRRPRPVRAGAGQGESDGGRAMSDNRVTAQGEDLLAYLDRAITARKEAARAVGFDTIETGDYLWDAKYLILRRGDESKAAPEMDAGLADHIALNDPASVLRRCAADRKVIELYRSYMAEPPQGHYADGGNRAMQQERSLPALRALRPVLQLLAEGYGWTEGQR